MRNYNLIPRDTIAKVKMTIKPGGYNDVSRGWTNGYATHNRDTGSVYLNVKFTILSGQYSQLEIWGRIGLHSEISEYWSKMGSTFAKSILCSAYGISLFDNSERAKNLCKLNSFAKLDGIEFLARIDVVQDKNGSYRNIIHRAITCDYRDYEILMEKYKEDKTYVELKK